MRDGKQMGRAHEVILQDRKLALGVTLEAIEERFAHQQSEYRVAQELETFVIRRLSWRGLGLVGTGTVRDRAGQQRAVGKAVAQRPLEFVQIGLQLLRCRRLGLSGAVLVRLRDALVLGRGVGRVDYFLEARDRVIVLPGQNLGAAKANDQ